MSSLSCFISSETTLFLNISLEALDKPRAVSIETGTPMILGLILGSFTNEGNLPIQKVIHTSPSDMVWGYSSDKEKLFFLSAW